MFKYIKKQSLLVGFGIILCLGNVFINYSVNKNMTTEKEVMADGSCRFYDNGIVEEEVSHGSPYGGPYNDMDHTDTFWPYQVWHYQMIGINVITFVLLGISFIKKGN